jgi:hypothetical protein
VVLGHIHILSCCLTIQRSSNLILQQEGILCDLSLPWRMSKRKSKESVLAFYYSSSTRWLSTLLGGQCKLEGPGAVTACPPSQLLRSHQITSTFCAKTSLISGPRRLNNGLELRSPAFVAGSGRGTTQAQFSSYLKTTTSIGDRAASPVRSSEWLYGINDLCGNKPYRFFRMASEAIITALATTSLQASGPPEEAYSSASVLSARS